MALNEYLVGEVAEEYSEGIVSRREALRRLCLLGLALPSATALLAACGGGDDEASAPAEESGSASGEESASPAPSTSASSTPQPTPGPDAGERITFDGKDGELFGAFRAPENSDDVKGAVLVMHENKGLTTHFYELVGRFAKDGYAALCVDLVSRAGGTDKFPDQAEATEKLGELSDDELLADLKSGLDELERRAKDAKIGAVGFCFGGGTTWKLLADGDSRIRAAVPFYGTPGEGDAAYDFSKTKAAVLAIYAGDDERVNRTRDAAEKGLKDAKLTYEVKTYDGAGHAFFNDTGPRYNEKAAGEARTAMLDWFEKHLT